MPTDLAVERIVQRNLLSCTPEVSILEAARRMADSHCSSIVVVAQGRPVGIWTERDALSVDLGDSRSFSRPISEVMSKPVKTIATGTTIGEAGMRFQLEGVRHFVVTDESGSAVGIVSQSDVILRHGIEHFLVLRNVRAAIGRPMVTVDATAGLNEVMARLKAGVTDAAVVVYDDGNEYGIVTERDVLRLIAARRGANDPIGGLASRPLICVQHDDSLFGARNLLEECKIRHLGVMGDDGTLIGLLSFSDILVTLQYEYVQRLDEALRERDEALIRSRKDLNLAHRVIEASLDGIMIVDANRRIEFVNPAFTSLTGYSAEEIIGRTPSVLKSGRHDDAFYTHMNGSLDREGYWQGEVWNRRKDGEVFPEWLTINAIRDDNGAVTQYAAIFTDITERKKTEERIKNLAYYDVLTGLPNRRLFSDRLQIAVANAHRHQQFMALMFLDLDLFKRINDSLGHGVGDQVLMEAAARLSHCVREGDTVARLGGDEFTILLPEIEQIEDAAKLAERVIAQIRQPFIVDDHELYITTSVGIALYPDDGNTAELLVKNADTAMYRAKDMGRNSFQLYAPAMNARSFERLAMEASLRHAVKKGEFCLVYQVKVNLETGRMSGVEALVRWNHPEAGLISPAVFIPLAEEMGVIAEIGEWVLREACRQCKHWHDLGLPPVRIAVNVSALQFRETRVPAVVASALAETGLPPQYLELELTETVLMQRVDEVVEVLKELRAMGVRISIDDFGTGYSSLSYLKRMPIDALKVDRSFVSDIFDENDTVTEDGAEIVSTIIGLAHNLRLKAIAEGVETPAQAAFLRAKGCDEVQGFLISRPVSGEDLISLFDRDLLPEAQV